MTWPLTFSHFLDAASRLDLSDFGGLIDANKHLQGWMPRSRSWYRHKPQPMKILRSCKRNFRLRPWRISRKWPRFINLLNNYVRYKMTSLWHGSIMENQRAKTNNLIKNVSCYLFPLCHLMSCGRHNRGWVINIKVAFLFWTNKAGQVRAEFWSVVKTQSKALVENNFRN